jgi:two-component system NtrC family sensor kinase
VGSSTTLPALDARTAQLVTAAKRQWERTFDAIMEPLMVVDDDFVVRRANLALADDLSTAVQRLVGRRCFEARRESPHAFAGSAGAPCDNCPVHAARQAGAACEGELKTASQRVYRLRAYPLEDETGEHLLVCSYRDVTEERQMSRQLAHAEKLASIGRLAAGVAHEINNPLGGILAFTQILMNEQAQDDEDRRECLQEIERSALRCKAVVESLMRFSRQSAHDEVGPVSLNDVVRAALRLCGHRLSLEGLEIDTQLQPGLPPVLGDSGQLEQVVLNLVTNAVDSVREVHQSGTGHIWLSTSVSDGEVLLEVSDNGRGVEEQHLDKLFDPFFTTKEEGKGSGLGLAVTYAIVKEHDGRIVVRNRPQGGAAFTVALTIASPR